MVTLIVTGCALIFMITRRIHNSQNYMLLENIRHLTNVDDLERIALEVTNKMADMNGHHPHSIIQTFSKGLEVKKKERQHIAYMCICCAVLDRDDRVMHLCGEICRELGIRQGIINDMLHHAIQDTGVNQVMGYSEEHLSVKHILDEALNRTQPVLPRS